MWVYFHTKIKTIIGKYDCLIERMAPFFDNKRTTFCVSYSLSIEYPSSTLKNTRLTPFARRRDIQPGQGLDSAREPFLWRLTMYKSDLVISYP